MNADGPPPGDFPAAPSQRSRIVRALLRDGEGLTRNEISKMTGIPLQSVCLRVGELLESRAVHRGPARACAVTRRENETILAPRGQTRLDLFWAHPAVSGQNIIPARNGPARPAETPGRGQAVSDGAA